MKTCLVFSLVVLAACGGEAASGASSASSAKATGSAAAKDSAAPKKDDKPADDKAASCASDKLKNCREYRGMNLAGGTDSLKSLCDSAKAIASDSTWKDEACPTAKVVAVCDMKMHKDYYYEGAEGLDSSEKFCKDGGHTWEKK